MGRSTGGGREDAEEGLGDGSVSPCISIAISSLRVLFLYQRIYEMDAVMIVF